MRRLDYQLLLKSPLPLRLLAGSDPVCISEPLKNSENVRTPDALVAQPV